MMAGDLLELEQLIFQMWHFYARYLLPGFVLEVITFPPQLVRLIEAHTRASSPILSKSFAQLYQATEIFLHTQTDSATFTKLVERLFDFYKTVVKPKSNIGIKYFKSVLRSLFIYAKDHNLVITRDSHKRYATLCRLVLPQYVDITPPQSELTTIEQQIENSLIGSLLASDDDEQIPILPLHSQRPLLPLPTGVPAQYRVGSVIITLPNQPNF